MAGRFVCMLRRCFVKAIGLFCGGVPPSFFQAGAGTLREADTGFLPGG